MRKLLWILLSGLFVLAACEPVAAPQSTAAPQPTAVPATESPSAQDVANAWQAALNKGDIDAALSYLAEEAVATISPAGPEGDAVFTGHAEIRGWYETLVTGKGFTTLSDCKVDGETIACLDTYSDEGLKSIGVDFIEGTWVATIRDGKIQSYTFTLTPESLAKLAPPPEPTPTLLPEVEIPVGQIADMLGVLRGRWSDSASLYTEFKINGEYRLFFKAAGAPPPETGKFSLEGNLLTWETGGESCRLQPTATYEVFVTKRGDQPIKLRFVLVGEDLCLNRKEYLDGKTLTFIEP